MKKQQNRKGLWLWAEKRSVGDKVLSVTTDYYLLKFEIKVFESALLMMITILNKCLAPINVADCIC